MAMTDTGRAMDLAHEDIVDALFGANAATAKLRSRAFLRSASKDQQELKRQNELLDLCGFVDQVLGGLGQLTNLHGELVKGMDGVMTSPKAALAGGGFVARLARWITGDKIGDLQRRIEAKRGLAGMEDYRSDFEVIQGQLGTLDKALRRFAAGAQIAERKTEDHREARVLDGARMDHAARGRAELGPRDELHVPMADRLARVESAAAFNEQAQKAVSRLLAKLFSPAGNLEVLLSGTTNQADLTALRLELPRGNLFRVMIQNLMAVRDELGARAAILEGVKVQ